MVYLTTLGSGLKRIVQKRNLYNCSWDYFRRHNERKRWAMRDNWVRNPILMLGINSKNVIRVRVEERVVEREKCIVEKLLVENPQR